jgi:hypothetical protein
LVRTPELELPLSKTPRLANTEGDSPLPRFLEEPSLATFSARSDASAAETTSLRSVNDVLVDTCCNEKINKQKLDHRSLHRFLCDKSLSDKSFRALLFTNRRPFLFREYEEELQEKNKLAKTMDLLDVSVRPISLQSSATKIPANNLFNIPSIPW